MAGIGDSDLLVWDVSKTSLQTKLGELVQYFQINVPTNGDGTPKSYIDPTVIAPYLLDVETPDQLSDETVNKATVPIEFDEGFPTVGGVPLWERFDGEPIPYYKLFKEYRDMRYLHATRSIAKLLETSGCAGRQLNALARVYHWQMRVKAYDKYKEAERQLMREHEINKLENKHAKISNNLLDQAVDYLTDHPEQLSAKTAIQLVELAMKAGRLAVGLNPDKPGTTAGFNGGSHSTPTINITNMNAGDNTNQANINLSEVEKQTQEKAQEVGTLQSIIHVLNKSGAFGVATGQTEQVDPVDENDDFSGGSSRMNVDNVDNDNKGSETLVEAEFHEA